MSTKFQGLSCPTSWDTDVFLKLHPVYPVSSCRAEIPCCSTNPPVSDVFSTAAWSGDIVIDFQIFHNLFQYSQQWILLLHWSLQYIRLKWSVPDSLSIQCSELQSIAVLHRFCSVISSWDQQSSRSSQYSLYFFWESSIPYSDTMASAIGLTETGPQMDWTRDAKIYDRYLNWKTKVELIFNSVLSKATAVQKSSYLRLWMGDPGIPLIRKWENTGRISFEHAEAAEGIEISNGYKLETFWNLLDEELKPKGNKLLSVIELWTRSKQGSKSLNEWLTYVHNLAELCDYPAASKERIIRDVLIINCSNEKAKDKIIWKGHEIKLEEVIGILQTEDSTQRTLQEMNSKPRNSTMQAMTRKSLEAKETRRRVSAVQHPKVLVLHHLNPPVLEDCVINAENHTLRNMKQSARPKQPSAMVVVRLVTTRTVAKRQETSPRSHSIQRRCISQALQNKSSMMKKETESLLAGQHMLSMKHSKPQQELLIQFSIGKDFHSIDKKVTLKLDTGADVNAFNQTTFRKLFPDVVLQPSTVVLENFDKTMVKPMGTFKCFLRWKGKVYRIQAEVMDSADTPNVLSRETTFLMGILKPCFVVKKVPEIPDGTVTMNCHSKVEINNSKSIQGSQMSCSSSTNTKKLVKTAVPPKDVQHIHPDSLKNKPLTQEMIETTYQDVFQGLGKFPGEPYKLRLKERTMSLQSIDHERFQSTSKRHFMRKCNDSSKSMY